MPTSQFELLYITEQSKHSQLMQREMKPGGSEIDGFRSDVCVLVECLCVYMEALSVPLCRGSL